VPIILIGFCSFIIANVFLGLFDEATIATLHCVAIDMDLNEGKPVFGPPTFHEKIEPILGESKRVYEEKHQVQTGTVQQN
jgi:hypothetical protein